MIQARAEDALPELEGERFSVLILSDVLEHIVDAEGVLRSCASLLEPGGTAVISVPNFRNFSVFYHLLMRGRLPEWDAGLFDRTHVRWTTKKLVSDWCEGAGLAVRTVTGNMTRRMRLLHWLGLGVFGDLPYRQILIVAEKI